MVTYVVGEQSGKSLLAEFGKVLVIERAVDEELLPWQRSAFDLGPCAHLGLHLLHYSFKAESVSSQTYASAPAPWHWFSTTAKRANLVENLVDAVEESLIVNVLTLGEHIRSSVELLFSCLLVAKALVPVLAAFLECQVEVDT